MPPKEREKMELSEGQGERGGKVRSCRVGINSWRLNDSSE